MHEENIVKQLYKDITRSCIWHTLHHEFVLHWMIGESPDHT